MEIISWGFYLLQTNLSLIFYFFRSRTLKFTRPSQDTFRVFVGTNTPQVCRANS